MQPLVLAIEPDLRQAAMVKRIVREKVLAEVAVVDSRDAALEAMRTTIPDVLLLSALLSPRDEDELVAHLRTLQHAEHLQTHTIPQLAASMSDEDKPSKGLLSAFRRRKGTGRAPAGCDPDLFAEEIRTYLHAASEKKREVRDTVAVSPFLTKASAAAPAASPSPSDGVETKTAETGSSWDSPFEWRPSTVTRTATVVEPEQIVPKPAPEPMIMEPLIAEPMIAEPLIEEPVALMPEPELETAPEPFIAEPFAVPEMAPAMEAAAEPEPIFARSMIEPEPEIVREPDFTPEPVATFAEPPAFEPAPDPVVIPMAAAVAEPEPVVIRPRLPLVMRIAREWWFEEGREAKTAAGVNSELAEVLTSLGIPMSIAAIVYADGCRIRRVRLTPA